MEQRIIDRFTPDVRAATAARYDLAPDELHELDGAESFIFRIFWGAEEFILRVGHTLRRSVALIQGEVDWMAYLHRHGAAMAAPVLSPRGALVEVIDDGQGGAFLATAFVHAPGGPPRGELWNPTLFAEYGRVLGRMHRVTRDYVPADPAWTRPQWDDDEWLFVFRYLPADQEAAHRYHERNLAEIRALPKDRDTYGLVHQDAHGGNFFVDADGGLTFFDFDDCAYTWFANDLAIVLFYAVANAPDRETAARAFLPPFLTGYRRECSLDPAWLQHFPKFLKLRELDLYALIHRDFDIDNLDHPWVRGFMEGRKARVNANTPYLDLDFGEFAVYLE